MTIKKTLKVKPTGSPSAAGAPSATVAPGGAAIADRLRLDLTDAKPQKAPSGPAITVAGIAGLIAFAVAGILTYMLYKHWEFLMPA